MKQILSVKKLSIELGVPRHVLIEIAGNKTKYYKPFTKTERKKDGTVKNRVIDNPNKSIRQIQRRINKRLLNEDLVALPLYMTGSIEGRSIRDNATPHLGQSMILCIDIADCFPSITSSKVYKYFRQNNACSPAVAKVLTKLTTYGDRLPQGAPSSPSLCNLIMQPLAAELHALAEKNELRFTQYIDDLTFSGDKQSIQKCQNKIIKIVEKHGYSVNLRKLKVSSRSTRMEITGLVVNANISVGRRYIRRIQRDIMDKVDATKIKGKISHVRSVNKAKSEKLLSKLNK